MPRQNFLAKESFVNASEKITKESILCIPVFASNIKLVSENQKLHSFRFLYHQQTKNLQYHIDVSVLPLNDQYTRVSLHGMHLDEHTFEHDENMAIALHDFESAAGAAVVGDSSLYHPYKPKTKGPKKLLQFAATVAASVGILFLKKKLS